MIEIQNTIVSEEIFKRKFVCDLSACKGACCIEGDAGAPLTPDEVEILPRIFPKVRPYMREEGISAILSQGYSVTDEDDEPVTTLVDGKECAYVIFDDKGVAGCAIEKAFLDGKIDFRKPISCHLYPIRIAKYKTFDAVNYHEWEVCKPACVCGEKLNVQVFRFLKEPIIRKYGMDYYNQLCEADRLMNGRQAE